ncbi:hypothetical protein PtrCC142_012062, partial [Pyrenophora tritici-repentis]
MRSFVGAIPRTFSRRQLLGNPDHPFLFDPSPDSAQSADAPRSISECKDIKLKGSMLSVTCLKESTQTATTLVVDLDICIANVNGLLTYNTAGRASRSCSHCSVADSLVLSCICDRPITNLPTPETSLTLELTPNPTPGMAGTGVYYTLSGS